MRGHSIEFYWMPAETTRWLNVTARELDLWIVVSKFGNPEREIAAGEISSDMLCDVDESHLIFFLGSRTDLGSPVWRNVHAKRVVDSRRSYPVQLIAPVLGPGRNVLLEGRIAIPGPNEGDDSVKVARLASLFGELRSSLKKHSDQRRVIVQDLTNGGTKRWPGKLVGRDVPDDGTLQLKQFPQGPVLFRIESSR